MFKFSDFDLCQLRAETAIDDDMYNNCTVRRTVCACSNRIVTSASMFKFSDFDLCQLRAETAFDDDTS